MALLRRAQRGDVEAMGEVALAFREVAVRRASGLLADRHEAEDAAQDALLLAFDGLPALRELEAFPAWLCMLVRTAVHRRARRRRPDLIDDPDLDAPADAPEPAAGLISAEVREAVRDAVRGLPPRHRSVVARYYLEERSVADIALDLGLPAGTVKRGLHDGRALLRRRLRDLDPRLAPPSSSDRRSLRLPLRSSESP